MAQVNQAKTSMEFAIHPALWDETYVGRRYVTDSQRDDVDTRVYSWAPAISVSFNTWTTEWMKAMQIAKQIKRMHACNTVWF